MLKMKFKIIPFEGRFCESFGQPEANGVWIVWGNSGNGKTTFALQMAKELCKYGKVVYDTLEEGARMSMQDAMKHVHMVHVGNKFQILNRESMDDLKVRLKKRNSPDFIFIDSFQYSGLSKMDVLQLAEEFPTKLFIFLSHADGRNPEGRPAKSIRYHADLKIFVSGFKAFPGGRISKSERKDFIIWEKGAEAIHGPTLKQATK